MLRSEILATSLGDSLDYRTAASSSVRYCLIGYISVLGTSSA